MGPGNKDKSNDSKPDYSYLSREVADWLATRDGYTAKDAAKDTGVSEKEAQEAMDTAKEDGSN